MTKLQEQQREEARQRLLEILKPGDTVFTILRHVSRSGMQRRIDLYKVEDGEPRELTWTAAKAMGDRVHKDGGIIVGGCGMDMGFHLVYSLSDTLFPDGYQCIGKNCPSNDHFNGDRNYEPHLHGSGGYALRHRWL